MNVENELPRLLEALADDHDVGPPPDVLASLDGHIGADVSGGGRLSKRLPLIAVAASFAVLVVGLVAVANRSSDAPLPDAAAVEPVATPEPSIVPDASPQLALMRIETRSADSRTTQIVLVFDGDLPDTSVSLLASAAMPLSTSIGYTTQDSSIPPTDVIVCQSTHSFGPGNQTVDLFVPSAWFDGPVVSESGVAQNQVPVIAQPGTEPANKIVLCEHEAGALQVAAWGAASGRTEDVDVTVEANTITVDIAPDPTREIEEPTVGAGISTIDGPLIRWAEPSVSDEGMDAEVLGVLELDQGCLYLVQDDERYPVLWPFGTSWNSADESVVLADGDSVAVGDRVTGSGGYLGARVVSQFADSDAGDIAFACADNRSGDAAIFNNRTTAVEST